MTLAPEVTARWPSAEAFYRERDDRTAREVGDIAHYVHQPVEIRIDRHNAGEFGVQQMALLVCNLTARWARRIRVVTPTVPLARELSIDRYATLPERIAAEMRDADPFGVQEVAQDAKPGAALRLWIGPCDSSDQVPSGDDYVVNAGGWWALGSRGRPPAEVPGQPTIAAAGLAASLGAADLFKRAIGHPRAQWLGRFAWSTWSHELLTEPELEEVAPPNGPLEAGRLLLAGAGAIGSAVIYLAAMTDVRGEITVLDRDHVETSNLNRAPTFFVDDVIHFRRKVDSAAAYLSRANLAATPVHGSWRDEGGRLAQEAFDIWISLTNEDGAWAQLPYLLPPVVLHGTTTSGWGFGCGRHIPQIEDCTACRMPRPAAEFRGPCAEGELSPEPQPAAPRASLPFLSAAAAALVLAELQRLGAAGAQEVANDVSADLRYGLPSVIATRHLSDPGCAGCRMMRLGRWKALGGRGRLAYLSAVSAPEE